MHRREFMYRYCVCSVAFILAQVGCAKTDDPLPSLTSASPVPTSSGIAPGGGSSTTATTFSSLLTRVRNQGYSPRASNANAYGGREILINDSTNWTFWSGGSQIGVATTVGSPNLDVPNTQVSDGADVIVRIP